MMSTYFLTRDNAENCELVAKFEARTKAQAKRHFAKRLGVDLKFTGDLPDGYDVTVESKVFTNCHDPRGLR